MGELSRRLLLSGLLSAAGSPVLWGQIPTDPEARLEAARYREVVLGDLKSSMEMYRSILAAPAAPRPVIARALFQ